MPLYVKLHNAGEKPFDFHHQNKKRIIRPGNDAVVPWDLATTLFGDPNLVDSVKSPDRTRVLAQVKGLFNFEDGVDTDETWEAKRPKVEVYDLETTPNARIYMILEDPEGEHFDGGFSGVHASESEINARTIANLQAQINAMQTMLELQLGAQPTSADAQGQTATTSTDAPDAAAPDDETFVTLPEGAKWVEDKDDPSGFSLQITPPEESPSEDSPSATPVLAPKSSKAK